MKKRCAHGSVLGFILSILLIFAPNVCAKSITIEDSIVGDIGKVPIGWEKAIEGKGQFTFEVQEDTRDKSNLIASIIDDSNFGRIAAGRKFCEKNDNKTQITLEKNIVIEFDICINNMSQEKWNEVDIYINEMPFKISNSANIVFIQKADGSKYIRMYDGKRQKTLMKWQAGKWLHLRLCEFDLEKNTYNVEINGRKFTSNKLRGHPKGFSQFLLRTNKKGKSEILIDNLKITGQAADKKTESANRTQKKDSAKIQQKMQVTADIKFNKNLITNGSFENGTVGWDASNGSVVISDDDAVDGSKSLHFHIDKGRDVISWRVYSTPEIPINPGDVFEFSVFAKYNHSAGVIEAAVDQIDQWNCTVGHKIACLAKAGKSDWKRYRIRFNTSLYTRKIFVYLRVRRMEGDFWVDNIQLKRIKPINPAAMNPIEAVTFPGSPSKFGMKVSKPTNIRNDSIIEINTTGAKYVIDTMKNTISCYQQLMKKRKVATIEMGNSLANLKIVSADNDAAVLKNDFLSIGIQGDSLIMFYAMKDIPLKITGNVKPKFHTRVGGYLIALDNFGGFGVYPSSPEGSGLGYSYVKQEGSTDKPPWSISLDIKKGYRLGFAVFPPRPFDFKRNYQWVIVHSCGYPPDKAIGEWRKYANVLTLHASPRKVKGLSGIWDGKCPWIGPYKLSEKSEKEFQRVINYAHSIGMKVIPYTAPGMHSNPNLDDFLNEIKSLKDKYHFDGIYYDGLYAAYDWTKSYILMRRTREMFGSDNPLYIHNTQSPPLADQRNGRIYCPFIDTYTDFLLRGESVLFQGLNDPYLRYEVSGYGTYSGIGMLKANRAKDIGDKMKYHLRMLELFGQARWGTYPDQNGVYPGEEGPVSDEWVNVFFPKLQEFKKRYMTYFQDNPNATLVVE